MSEKFAYLPPEHTIGDFISAVLSIDNERDAQRFYDWYVGHISGEMAAGLWEDQGTAEDAARSNLGWCFGEGMASERQAMWVRVCGASHPVFGTMATPPTPEEWLEAGRRLARGDVGV